MQSVHNAVLDDKVSSKIIIKCFYIKYELIVI